MDVMVELGTNCCGADLGIVRSPKSYGRRRNICFRTTMLGRPLNGRKGNFPISSVPYPSGRKTTSVKDYS